MEISAISRQTLRKAKNGRKKSCGKWMTYISEVDQGDKSWGCSKHLSAETLRRDVGGSKEYPLQILILQYEYREKLYDKYQGCFVLLPVLNLKKRKRLGITDRWYSLSSLKAVIVLLKFWKKKNMSDTISDSLDLTVAEGNRRWSIWRIASNKLLQKWEFTRKFQLNNKAMTKINQWMQGCEESWGLGMKFVKRSQQRKVG